MTDPRHKLGDIVNGHRLTQQPDGSQVWLPTEASPQPEPVDVGSQHKPGDIVNGHRLTDQNGTLVWLPVDVDPTPKKSKRPLWITLGALGAVLLLIIIIGSLNRGSRVDTAANDEPAAVAEPAKEAPAEPEEPEKLTVPSVVGMTAGQAVSTLRAAGFEVAEPANAGDIVTATAPQQGGIAEEGSTVTLTVEPPLSLEQQNALEQAQSYLDYSSFSRQGLIDQMSSEYGSGYPVEVATWAVDYLNPDWTAEAIEQAKSYLEYSSFSRDGLYEQMTSEFGSQFTPEQANAALTAVGY